MSKFCQNCGAELADADMFCQSCGTKQEATEAAAPAENNANDKAQQVVDNVSAAATDYVEKAKKDPKLLILPAAILVAVIALFAIIGSSSKAYLKPVNYMMEMTQGNFKNLEKCAPKEYWEYMEEEGDMSNEDLKEEIEENEVGDNIKEQLEETYGKNVRMKYKVTDKDKLSDKKLSNIKDGLKENYDIAKKSVKKAYKLELEITTKGSEDEDEDEAEIIVVKIGNKWYCCSEDGYFNLM